MVSSERKSHYDYHLTTPATQMSWTCRPWCAGHRWRSRRGLGWLHRAGHAARLLRVQQPRTLPELLILDPKQAPQLRNPLTMTDIGQIWRLAGGNTWAAPVAVAVAFAESGGYAGAIANDGGMGLWQGKGAELLNPYNAAKEAINRSNNGQDWSQFPGYKNWKYRAYLDEAVRIGNYPC